MRNLTDEQSARLVEIAREHCSLAARYSREWFTMTVQEKAQVKERINELRRERDALLGESG